MVLGRAISFYACPDIPEQVAPYQNLNHRTFNPGTNNTLGFAKTSFAAEPLGSFGNIGRNAFYAPGINNTNIVLAKNFALSSDGVRSLQLRMESDNVFNHTQFIAPTSNFASGTFGQITSAASGRLTQIAGKIYF